ncbi:MAG: ion channel [Pirellulaceae bacterium]
MSGKPAFTSGDGCGCRNRCPFHCNRQFLPRLDHLAVRRICNAEFPQPNLIDITYLVIVTYTSLGYGDMVPHGAMRLFVGKKS